MALTILALDTSTDACSAALLYNDEIISDFVVSAHDHSKHILPMIDHLLAAAGFNLSRLDAIAFSRGPGSFTGVRIGIAVAQGLAFGADKPLISVSTLQTLAQGVYRCVGENHVVSAIDARMNEVYLGQYRYNEAGNWEVLCHEQVICPQKVAEKIKLIQHNPIFSAGTGFQTYPDMLPQSISSHVFLPNAQDMLPLAAVQWHNNNVIQVDDVEPVYLRNNIACKKRSDK